MTTRSRLAAAIGPIVLILVGLAFLSFNLGLASTDFWTFILNLWPILVIALALSMFLSGSIFLPLTLTAFAIGFLLANLGIVDWDMWKLLGQLWPLLLVAIGLDVLLTSRLRRSQVRTEVINQPMEGAKTADVKIEPGIGRLQLGAGEAGDALLAGSVTMAEGEHAALSFGLQGDEARLKLRQSVHWYFPFMGAWAGDRQWELRLHPTLPTRLRLDGGLSRRSIDLRGINLTDLILDGGIGEMNVILPAQGILKAKINGGIGDKHIQIPASMAAAIKISGGLGTRHVQGDYVVAGNTYTSPGFDAAPNRLDMTVDHGIGSLTIVQVA